MKPICQASAGVGHLVRALVRALLCRIRLYGVKGGGCAAAYARPAGGTSGTVLGRAISDGTA
jgi:hypothetical protein